MRILGGVAFKARGMIQARALIERGLPGLILALVMATVQEPKRRGLISGSGSQSSAPRKALPVRRIYEFLRDDRRTFVPIFAAMGVKAMLSFGTGLWIPAFFV